MNTLPNHVALMHKSASYSSHNPIDQRVKTLILQWIHFTLNHQGLRRWEMGWRAAGGGGQGVFLMEFEYLWSLSHQFFEKSPLSMLALLIRKATGFRILTILLPSTDPEKKKVAGEVIYIRHLLTCFQPYLPPPPQFFNILFRNFGSFISGRSLPHLYRHS